MAGKPRITVRIVAMGDSTTAGTPGFLSPIEAPPAGAGDERSQYAYWVMRKHPGWKVLNRGVNGERTDQILARFRRDVIDEEPRVVVVLGGVNDVYQRIPPSSAEQNLSAMYEMASEAGIASVACTVLPYNTMGSGEGAARDELNAWIRRESSSRGLTFCDTAAAVSDPQRRDRLAGSPDGLHPDVDGYRRMAIAISEAIGPIVGVKRGPALAKQS